MLGFRQQSTILVTSLYFSVDAQAGDNTSRDAARLITIARGVLVEKVLGNVFDPGVRLNNLYDTVRTYTANGAVASIEVNVAAVRFSPPATRREAPIGTPHDAQKTVGVRVWKELAPVDVKSHF